jgi:hypothetical protein
VREMRETAERNWRRLIVGSDPSGKRQQFRSAVSRIPSLTRRVSDSE